VNVLHRRWYRCRVCGFAEIEADAVFHRELVFLAECPRCEHRFTTAEPPPRRAAVARAGAGPHREAAPAA
jgi:rubredoxin